jgi:hypothetical protein
MRVDELKEKYDTHIVKHLDETVVRKIIKDIQELK